MLARVITYAVIVVLNCTLCLKVDNGPGFVYFLMVVSLMSAHVALVRSKNFVDNYYMLNLVIILCVSWVFPMISGNNNLKSITGVASIVLLLYQGLHKTNFLIIDYDMDSRKYDSTNKILVSSCNTTIRVLSFIIIILFTFLAFVTQTTKYLALMLITLVTIQVGLRTFVGLAEHTEE